jgi:hypothetical protein
MRCTHYLVCLVVAASAGSLRIGSGAHAAAGEGPRPQVITPAYESAFLKQFDRTARDVIRGDDHNAAWDAVALAYDLRRPDLLAAALGARWSNVRLVALTFLEKMPLESRRTALILSLADDDVFPPRRENEKAEQDRVGTLERYQTFAKFVCRPLGIRTTDGSLNLHDKGARDHLRLRVMNIFVVEERR